MSRWGRYLFVIIFEFTVVGPSSLPQWQTHVNYQRNSWKIASWIQHLIRAEPEQLYNTDAISKALKIHYNNLNSFRTCQCLSFTAFFPLWSLSLCAMSTAVIQFWKILSERRTQETYNLKQICNRHRLSIQTSHTADVARFCAANAFSSFAPNSTAKSLALISRMRTNLF